MKLSGILNLEKGRKYKYKELCEMFEENISTGNGKKAQLERWKFYFDFEKIKYDYLIKEVYRDKADLEVPSNYKGRKSEINIPFKETFLYSIVNDLRYTGKKYGISSLGKKVVFEADGMNDTFLFKKHDIFILAGIKPKNFHYAEPYKELNIVEGRILKECSKNRMRSVYEKEIKKLVKDGVIKYRKVVAIKTEDKYKILPDDCLETWNIAQSEVLKEMKKGIFQIIHADMYKALLERISLKLEESNPSSKDWEIVDCVRIIDFKAIKEKYKRVYGNPEGSKVEIEYFNNLKETKKGMYEGIYKTLMRSIKKYNLNYDSNTEKKNEIPELEEIIKEDKDKAEFITNNFPYPEFEGMLDDAEMPRMRELQKKIKEIEEKYTHRFTSESISNVIGVLRMLYEVTDSI